MGKNRTMKVSLQILSEAMSLLAQPDHPNANRAEQLLEHFSKLIKLAFSHANHSASLSCYCQDGTGL